ncbi:MAG: STAS domain-containing protein [Oxalobacter sp.]|nr:MAG: STAS domain-containing protein [Oxalobacter sp.]
MIYQPDTPLTMSSAKEALEKGLRAIESGATAIDLASVSATDSVAVSILLAWERAALARGASIVFLNASTTLVSLAKLYGVFELLHFTTDPAQAFAQGIAQDITQALSQAAAQDSQPARH